MLDQAELDELIALYEPDPSAAAANWRSLFDPGAAGPVALVNRLQLREQADYPDGRVASGFQALMAYAATSVAALERVGGRFLVSGPVLAPLFGSDARADVIVVGWYPDRSALLALLRDPEYRSAFEHRRAAVSSQWVVAAGAMTN